MEVAQISIFLENRSGGLADVIDVLARSSIDIKALTLADMADFGILRLIVEDPERTRKVLKESGFTVDKTRVVGWRRRSTPCAAPASTSSTCTPPRAGAVSAPSSSSAWTRWVAPPTRCAAPT
jgi:hypothetical protein